MTKGKTLRIHKVARIHDKASETYFEVIEFPTSESERRRLELPPSIVANDPSGFENKLRDAGAILPKEKTEVKRILQLVADSRPREEWDYEKRSGWTPDKNAFVLLDSVIGTPDKKVIGVNRSRDSGDHSGQLSTAGKSRSWRDSVAETARNSTTLMLGISVALAAPLLAYTKCQSFALNMFAKTRAGKSVATLAAGSVIGTARTADLVTWNITDARLEERLSEFNDQVFPIDDLSTMKGDKRQKYLRIRELAYKIGQGWTTGRHSSFTAPHREVQQPWRLIALTSSETSVRDLAQATRQERQHGEVLRLIDVPATFDGLDHIFDRLPQDADPIKRKRELFHAIPEACEQNQGKVFRKYVKDLIAEREKLPTWIPTKVSFFVKKVCDDFNGDIARDVAEKFGLIYAGGMLGIRYRIVPWSEGELLDALAKAYAAALAVLPDDGASLRRGRAELKKQLRELPSISMPNGGDALQLDYEKLPGYRWRTSEARHYVIKNENFTEMFASAEQQRLVVAWLTKKKRITLASPKKSSDGGARSPKRQFTWPDGKRRRSFEIVWPRGQETTGSSLPDGAGY
jgi:putative DNA primase/helicase